MPWDDDPAVGQSVGKTLMLARLAWGYIPTTSRLRFESARLCPDEKVDPAMSNPNPPASNVPAIYVDPDGAGVVHGILAPGANIIQAMLAALQADLNSDQQLAARWKQNPASIMAERGYNQDLQNEVLSSQGISVPEACGFTCFVTDCGSTIRIVVT
jgi:hypothetical protein